MRYHRTFLLDTLIFLILAASGCAPESSEEVSRTGSTLKDWQPMSKAEAVRYLQAVVHEAEGIEQDDKITDIAITHDQRVVDEEGIHVRTEGSYQRRLYFTDRDENGFGNRRYTLSPPESFVKEFAIAFKDVNSIKIEKIENRSDTSSDDLNYKVTVFYGGDKMNKRDWGKMTQHEAHKTASAFAALCPQFEELMKPPKSDPKVGK